MAKSFDPNKLTFEEGSQRVAAALKKAKVTLGKRILTSKDRDAVKLANLLAIDNIPDGFRKWQLPFVMDPSQLFISVGNPGAVVKKHSHKEGDGIRFIAGGSILYEGQELVAGDWMYIPRGKPYSFRVGPFGATMCYCYCCCCAGSLKLDPGGDVMFDR
ncbi:MAG: hypothetical protein IT459_10440 [Planctomycetes bacterium]|nr:hypothetical protein [Planctomycetota bacterium]